MPQTLLVPAPTREASLSSTVRTNATTHIADPDATGPYAVVVNSTLDKIYIGNSNTANSYSTVTVVDGLTNSFVNVTDPTAGAWDNRNWKPPATTST